MAKAKRKTSKTSRSKKSNNTGMMRLLGLALMLVSGYVFWQLVSDTVTNGTAWWVKSLAASIVFLYSLYVFATGKADVSDLVQNI
jgi:cation transport ATPase